MTTQLHLFRQPRKVRTCFVLDDCSDDSETFGDDDESLSYCEQHTHNYNTCRVAQHDHISSRDHAWLKLEGSGLHIFVS